MKLNGSWQRALIGLLVVLMAMPVPVFAQNNIPVFRQEELDQILAPIALYPDSLLAQILMAATYPVEVVQADRWVKSNRNLPPDALNDVLDRQTWDPSVKALVPFPNILSMMSERLDWTQQVGDAFLAQEQDVMATIQDLRAKAYAAGNLRSTQQQTVSRQGTIIVIEPASPQVVYVPVYSPMVVYGNWWYPAYPPVVIYPYPPSAFVMAGVITFGVGIGVAMAWNHWWGYWDWGHRHVYVNVNRTVNIHRTTVVHTRQIQTTTWRHDPVHRKGVSYRDPRTREKYAPANRQAVDNRRDFRGYDQRGPAAPGSTVTRPDTRPGSGTVVRPSTQTRPESTASRPGTDKRTGPAVTRPAPATTPAPGTVARPSTQAKPAPTVTRPAPETKAAPSVTRPAPATTPAPGTVARPSTQAKPVPTVTRPAPETKAAPSVTRPAPATTPAPGTVARPSTQTRQAPAVSRPAPSNTIYRVEQGSKARQESARGRESLSAPRGKSESPPKASPGVSRPAPAERSAPAQGGGRQQGGGPGRK